MAKCCKMRKLLIFNFLVLSITSYGQVEQNNNYSPALEESEKKENIELEDSLSIKPVSSDDNDDNSPKGAAYKKKSAERSLKTEQPSVKAERSVSQEEVQSVSYEFNYSKQQSSTQRTQRSPNAIQQKTMNEAVDYFEENSPNSFEYHYFKYTSGNYDISRIEHLKKAEKMRPDNSDVHIQMAAYHMIENNTTDAKVYLEKLRKSKRLTEVVIHYAKDILYSVQDSGILITHGFDDTYAAWYDQNVKGIRKDVRLVSLDFLQSKAYRDKLSKAGILLPTSTVVNVAYLKEFCRLNAKKGIAVSLTTPKEYFEPIQDKLYVTGLVFEYHTESFNNFDRNETLWNSTLDKHLVTKATDEKGKQLSSNYLPMLFQLRAVYEEKGEADKLAAIDKSIDGIAVQCKKYEKVQQLKRTY